MIKEEKIIIKDSKAQKNAHRVLYSHNSSNESSALIIYRKKFPLKYDFWQQSDSESDNICSS